MLRKLVLAAGVLAVSYNASQSHEQSAGALTIFHAWAEASSDGAKDGAVYATSITNSALQPDTLIGATTPVAERAELHAHVVEKGVVRMQAVEGVEIAPGTPTVLRPGGVHIMLWGLKEPLKVYGTFPLTLQFANAGAIEIEVMIEELGTIDPKHQEPSS